MEKMKKGEKKVAKPLSQEIRETIIYHKKNGEKNTEVSKWLRVTTKSVQRIWKQYREENTIKPKPHNKGRKAALCEKTMEQITERVKLQPDITLAELVEEFNLNISISALSRKLTKLDLTFKKNVVSKRTITTRRSVASRRVDRIYKVY